MTHIVILFTRTQQEMSDALSESRLNAWLNKASKTTLGSANLWTKLDTLLGLPQKQDPQVLNLTPVRVELGMRDSVCYALTDKNAVISDEQVAEFNDFFSGVFRLIKTEAQQYQMHFQQFLQFNLPIEHFPPYFNDYRVQIEAAGSGLKSHLTELQSWCYKQENMWNAFYLWSRPKDEALEKINLDDRTQLKTLSKLKVFHEGKPHAELKLILTDELNSLSFELMKMEQQFKDSDIDQLTLSFADENVYQLSARDFYPWWKKIFSS